MKIKTIKVGGLQTNCYIVSDEASSAALVIDPGDEAEKILPNLSGLKVLYIVLTHAHYDHVGALDEIKSRTEAKLLKLKDGDKISLGKIIFRIIATPGHTEDSLCLYSPGVLFSGDTLFSGTYGRTDLPGGSEATMRQSLKKLADLPDDTMVYPGHDEITTIKTEKERGTLG
ncbi:MBL fold metallo-hydrolase [Candidatus Saganbacteria bacterium]|nr:MBL fold metallo-hydrolase [Candidatus Saganbacteria bacterium]